MYWAGAYLTLQLLAGTLSFGLFVHGRPRTTRGSLAVSAVRVLIVSTVAVYRHGIADALSRRDKLDLVTTAATPSEAFEAAAAGHEAYPKAEGRHVVC